MDAEMDLEEAAVCGSFSFCAAAAVTDVEEAATLAADAEMTAVCGLSFFCAAVAAAVVDSAANTCRENISTKHKDCGPDIPGRSFLV